MNWERFERFKTRKAALIAITVTICLVLVITLPLVLVKKSLLDANGRLILTPLIRKGDLKEAQEAAEVSLPVGPPLKSYSGFLTVNEEYNSNLFFWFFPNRNSSVPILLWIDGGPGASSISALFTTNGPLQINLPKSHEPSLRQWSWSNNYHLIYIDQPAGTGFSFTDDERGYANNQDDVARDLFEALQQFFTLFNEYQNNPFFITGESYAGKYIPAIANKISQEGSKAKMNLKGLALGNPLVDPISQIDYASMLYQVGLFNKKQSDYCTNVQSQTVELIKKSNYTDAVSMMFKMMLGGRFNDGHPSWMKNVTGQRTHYSFIRTTVPASWEYYNDYLESEQTRKVIHVGNQPFREGSSDVAQHLTDDIMRSVKTKFEELLAKYRIMIYSGNVDIIVGTPLTSQMLTSISWPNGGKWPQAKKQIWKVDPDDDEVAGYVRKLGNFSYVIVRNAGHVVPADQSRAALDMITRFVENRF